MSAKVATDHNKNEAGSSRFGGGHRRAITLDTIAQDGVKDEYGDYVVYRHLADSHKAGKLGRVFEELSRTEYKHYEFWRKYSPKTEAKVTKLKLYGILILGAIFGATFAIKFLERHERSTIKQYKLVEQLIPNEDRIKFNEMVRDEQEIEVDLAKEVQGNFVKYISFIVLGLADALVEVSGIHAGSLGVYNSAELTGLAGIIAGAAASMAMASAAYAQAKQGFQGSAAMSAIMTGVSYFVSAVVLASPYFLTNSAIHAMIVSLTIAVIVLAITSYYNSIISGTRFSRDFLELAAILFGATIALFFFGETIRSFLGLAV